MPWQPTPFLPLLVVSALILALLGAYAWRHRQVRGAPGFIILMGGGAVWAVSYGLHLASADGAWAALWIGFIYLGIVAQPIGWLLLAVEYAGWGRGLTRGTVGLLVLAHLAFVGLVFTTTPPRGGSWRGGWRCGGSGWRRWRTGCGRRRRCWRSGRTWCCWT